MTMDQHKQVGRKLQAARNMLTTMSVELAHIYGKTKGPSVLLGKAADIIDKARSELDNRLFEEYPNLKTADGIYYGATHDPSDPTKFVLEIDKKKCKYRVLSEPI